VALSAELVKERKLVHWILNAYWEPLDFELPEANGCWKRWIDTSLDSPEDIVPWQDSRPFTGHTYRVGPHSIAILYTPLGQSSTIQQTLPLPSPI
jgi:glycogen operon protein